MSFPRYPKYKPSGVEWLGEVPEHWALPKLKGVATFSGGGTPSRDNPAYWNGDIPWVSPKDMKAERIEGAEESITEEGLRSSASNLLPPGRVLIVVRSGILKHTIPIAINETEVALNQDMKALSFDRSKCVSRFFLRWVQGHNDQLLFAWAKQGATVESIEHSYLAQTVIPLPDIPEQTAIAEFLDRETGKIDGLVAEQRRLIELLKEKRQAVISHAVTKGLNPHAPMKPSGIEWIGDVPEGWAFPKIKSIATFSGGGTPSRDNPAYWNGDIPWVSPKDMKAEQIMGAEESITDEGLKSSASNLLPSGRVLIVVRSGILKHTIPIAINETAVALNQDMKALSFDATKCDARFFLRWVQGHNEQLLFAWSKQGATVESIEHSYLAQTVIPLPDLPEQKAIVAFLDSELAKFDTLTAEAQRAIDFLQERRTALISAAVTGQIDVRQPTRN